MSRSGGGWPPRRADAFSSSDAAPAASRVPVARAGADIVGIDRSEPMLERGRQRLRRARLGNASLVRGDIRHLPFRKRAGFTLVMAPYGILQSLTREKDLRETIAAVHGVLPRKGLFVVDLVPDLPAWDEYARRTEPRGSHARGHALTLIESVRQDTRRRLTIFDQEYVERRGGRRRVHRFSLTFRTLSVPQMSRRLEEGGFRVRRRPRRLRRGPVGPPVRRLGAW